MSVFSPLTGGAQVELVFQLGAYFMSVRLWYVYTLGSPGDTEYFLLAQSVQTVYGLELMPYLSADLTLLRTVVTPWEISGQTPFLYDVLSYIGGNTSGSHSANVGIVVRTRSALNVRAILNWNFTPGIPLDQVETNTYSTVLADHIVDAYSELFDTPSGLGWRRVCVSQISGGVPRASARALRADLIEFPTPYVTSVRRRLKSSHLT